MKNILCYTGLVLCISVNSFSEEFFLIDDFSSSDRQSVMKTEWEGFTDTVMGGTSSLRVTLMPADSGFNLRMTGRVSLENNGGFIQTRLFLRPDKKPYNASRFKGIQIRIRGKSDSYYIFLRTNRTIFPWSYFGRKLPVTEDWTVVKLPFSGFTSENMVTSRLNPKKLKSIGIVAAYSEFEPDLEVEYIGFYK